MSKPTQSTEWASDDSNAIILETTPQQKSLGWSTSDGTLNGVPDKPTLNHENYFKNAVHRWVVWLDQLTSSHSQAVFAVGSVQQSVLEPVAFRSQMGLTWVLMDGSDCTGSTYEVLTGSSTVPDASGAFIRSVGGEADAVGVLQADSTARNGLTVQWGSANVDTNTATATWASNNATVTGDDHFHFSGEIHDKVDGAAYGHGTRGNYLWKDNTMQSTTANWVYKTSTSKANGKFNKNLLNSNQNAHKHYFNKNALNSDQSWAEDTETRPLNIALYYYIKIN